MIKNVLTSIGGVGLYGIISLCLFFSVFLGTLLWVLSLKKSYLNSMREMPLENDSPNAAPNDSPSETTSNSESRHE